MEIESLKTKGHSEIEKEKQRDRKTNRRRQTEIETRRQIDTETERHGDRETWRQRDMETQRHGDRKTQRRCERAREREEVVEITILKPRHLEECEKPYFLGYFYVKTKKECSESCLKKLGTLKTPKYIYWNFFSFFRSFAVLKNFLIAKTTIKTALTLKILFLRFSLACISRKVY